MANLVDVSNVAKEAGIKFPVAVARTVWAKYVEVPFADLGIVFEEKVFYDILKALAKKYPEEKLIPLSKKVTDVVDDKAKYTCWSKRYDIKAELKAE